MSETEFTYELLKPLSYTPKNAGEPAEASFILLKEPGVKQLSSCAPLKQAFMRAIAEQAKEADAVETDHSSNEKDDTPMSQKIISALYASNADMSVVFLTAKELFKQVAFVEGERPMTVPLLDSMKIEDLEAMTGQYMENFILASVLEDQ